MPETLETERLRLPRAEDFPAHAAILADSEANRFIGGAELADRGWGIDCIVFDHPA